MTDRVVLLVVMMLEIFTTDVQLFDIFYTVFIFLKVLTLCFVSELWFKSFLCHMFSSDGCEG